MMPKPSETPSKDPRRRLKPGVTAQPSIEIFQSVETGKFLALLRYNSARPVFIKDDHEQAYDAAFQFYMSHTGEGMENSESE